MGGAVRPGAPRDLLLTPPLLLTGVLRFCAVGRQQPGLLHDVGQDLPPELVEPRPDRCRLQTRGLGSWAGAPRARQQDPGSRTVRRPRGSPPPSCSPYQFVPNLFKRFFL